MHEVSGKKKRYYFSEELKSQLAQISDYPLTIIEAPSGFGKTTAVREHFKENCSEDIYEYWYTCLGEAATITWAGLCELISKINAKVADDLRNLKIPTKDTLHYILSYIKEIHCTNETYIVIDNYHLINYDISHELIQIFSAHASSNLHMIIITQQINTKYFFWINSEYINLIEASAFFIDRKGISSLFQMRGIHLSKEEVEKVFLNTEGWISAINLQIISFIKTGSINLTADIEQLVEHAIWNHLDIDEKEFLLSVSVLDSFTTYQASIMICDDILPDKIQKLLKCNDFIKYLPDKGTYSIHSIIHDYLKNRFQNYTLLNYRDRIFRRAALASSYEKQYYQAAEFYYKVGDFNAILSIPYSREYSEQEKEKYQYKFFAKIVNECPDEILCNHPFTMIVFGYMALMNGFYAEYQKLYILLNSIMENKSAYPFSEFQRLRGEFLLLQSVSEFNDVEKMQELHIKCYELLKGPSHIIKWYMPVFFGDVSVLNMLWRESGRLDEVSCYLQNGNQLYLKLTQGHGAGTCYTMMAEENLMRGDDVEAEIQCHRALYEARGYKKTDTCLCVELVLARIAILRGDIEEYFSTVKRIQNYANENSSLYILRMVEYCMSIISLLLNFKDYVSPWFYDMESIKRTVYTPVVPQAQLIHFLLLIFEKRYHEFYGICQYEIEQERNSTQNTKYLMTQVYRLIFIAIAKRSTGYDIEAQKYLKEALNLALPDKIYLPFAQQECMVEFLCELKMNCTDCDCEYFGKNSDLICIAELCKRQKKGVSIIRKAINENRSPLTPREREIALLAKERYTAKEIASKLFISEMTVKTTLRNVYSKLDIHSKVELNLIVF